jgi:hypothetical protein
VVVLLHGASLFLRALFAPRHAVARPIRCVRACVPGAGSERQADLQFCTLVRGGRVLGAPFPRLRVISDLTTRGYLLGVCFVQLPRVRGLTGRAR